MYTRRQFLKDLGRGALALAVGGGIAALTRQSGSSCPNDYLCRDCGQVRDCKLPQGLAARQSLRKEQFNG